MMKRTFVLSLLVLTLNAVTLWAQEPARPAYRDYEETVRTVSELDWRLLQVNARAASKDVEVAFEPQKRIFQADTWVLPSELARLSNEKLRELLQSKAALVRAIIGRYFPDFKTAGSRDLRVQFIVADQEHAVIATWEDAGLAFTPAYRQKMERLGRR